MIDHLSGEKKTHCRPLDILDGRKLNSFDIYLRFCQKNLACVRNCFVLSRDKATYLNTTTIKILIFVCL